MAGACWLFILTSSSSLLFKLTGGTDFSRLNLRLINGQREASLRYGFLEVSNAHRSTFVKVCDYGWTAGHAIEVCKILGQADGINYHERVKIRYSSNKRTKGFLLGDILIDKFYVKPCARHVLLLCFKKAVSGLDHERPGLFRAFQIPGNESVEICRDEESNRIAKMVCSHLGFDGGIDYTPLVITSSTDTERANCRGSNKLEDCQITSERRECNVINFDCFYSMTFTFDFDEVLVNIDPYYCRAHDINIVNLVPNMNKHSLQVQIDSEVVERNVTLYNLSIRTNCTSGDNLEFNGAVLENCSLHLVNCLTFNVTIVTTNPSGEAKCADSTAQTKYMNMKIGMVHQAGAHAVDSTFFKTNYGLVVVTVLVFAIIFILVFMVVDTKPDLPRRMKRYALPRVPPPSMINMADPKLEQFSKNFETLHNVYIRK